MMPLFVDLVYSKANKRVVTCASIQVKSMTKIIQLDGVNVGGIDLMLPSPTWFERDLCTECRTCLMF